MDITDNGLKPNAFSIDTATRGNADYRRVIWTGEHLQVALMSLEPGDVIGLEVHHGIDQYLRIGAGKARVKMGPAKDDLSLQRDAEGGWSIQVPAGMWREVENIGEEPLRLYTVCAPVNPAQETAQGTPEAEAEDQGSDEPTSWVAEVKDKSKDAGMTAFIDTSFNFRSDSPPSKDPDKCKDPDRYSPTLRRYHQVL
nr:cupin domain-containing protein [Arthrobacter sp. JZ12]